MFCEGLLIAVSMCAGEDCCVCVCVKGCVRVVCVRLFAVCACKSCEWDSLLCGPQAGPVNALPGAVYVRPPGPRTRLPHRVHHTGAVVPRVSSQRLLLHRIFPCTNAGDGRRVDAGGILGESRANFIWRWGLDGFQPGHQRRQQLDEPVRQVRVRRIVEQLHGQHQHERRHGRVCPVQPAWLHSPHGLHDILRAVDGGQVLPAGHRHHAGGYLPRRVHAYGHAHGTHRCLVG